MGHRNNISVNSERKIYRKITLRDLLKWNPRDISKYMQFQMDVKKQQFVRLT
jgi:hypothetical protein